VLSFRPRAGRMEGKAYIDGKLACEATLTCMVVPRVRETQPAAPEAPTAPTDTVSATEAVVAE